MLCINTWGVLILNGEKNCTLRYLLLETSDDMLMDGSIMTRISKILFLKMQVVTVGIRA